MEHEELELEDRPSPVIRQPGRNQKKIHAGSVVHLLTFYINFGYYTGIIPFRVVVDHDADYKLVTSIVQKNICRVFHLLTLLYELYTWRSLISSGQLYELSTGNTSEIFQVLLGVTETMYILMYFHILWASSNAFVKIINEYPYRFEDSIVLSSEDAPTTVGKFAKVINFLLHTHLAGVLLCLLATLLALQKFTKEYQNEIIFGEDGYLANETKFYFFMNPSTNLNTGIVNFLSSVYVLAGLTLPRVVYMIDLFFCLIAFLLYEVACNVEKTLQNPQVQVQQVLDLYSKAKSFVDILNVNFGKLTLALVLTFIPYYADKVPKFVTETDEIERAVITVNLFSFSLFLYLASTFANKMKCLQNYLADEDVASSISDTQLRVMLDEIESQKIGLSAYGFFIVTYTAIAHFIHLLATYGFIATQNKGNGVDFGNVTGISADDFLGKIEKIMQKNE